MNAEIARFHKSTIFAQAVLQCSDNVSKLCCDVVMFIYSMASLALLLALAQ